MDTAYLVALLFLITLSAVLVFAVATKVRMEKRMKNDDTLKSSHAADGEDD